jgi:hypothetical protein
VTDEIFNCYEVLGVSRDATTEEVRAAFRLRSHMFHPDKYANYGEPLRSQLVAEAVKEFKKLTGAYDVLRDPVRRAAHDRELARGVRVAPAPAPRRASAVAPRRAPAVTSRGDATPSEEAPRRTRRAASTSGEPPRDPDPQLLVRPERLDFGIVSPGAIGQLALRIENRGGRVLFGEVASDKAWVTVSERNFIANKVVVAVNLNTDGLRAGQAHAATITVRTMNGGEEAIPVSVRIAAVSEPQLAGVPAIVEFGEAVRGKRKVRTITLTNSGTGTLSGAVNTRLPWLSVSEREFLGNTVSLDLIADTTGLAPGEHTGKVAIASNGGHGTITVIMNVAVPVAGEALAPLGQVDAPDGSSAQFSEVPPAEPAGPLPRAVQRELLDRISRLEPETDWEAEFLTAIAQIIRAGRTLARGELAKVYELEARAAGN